jgi:hypothetical protein
MPLYRCHKEVWALKIKSVHPLMHGAAGAELEPEDTRFSAFKVDAKYMAKHEPKAGGYYVVYKDGYQSFSPAEAFESGYTRADGVDSSL